MSDQDCRLHHGMPNTVCKMFMSRVHCLESLAACKSGHVRPRQGTDICDFRMPSPLDFLGGIFSPVDFSFFSRFTVQFSKEVAPKCRCLGGEKSIRSCHVCGCHGFSVSSKMFVFSRGVSPTY